MSTLSLITEEHVVGATIGAAIRPSTFPRLDSPDFLIRYTEALQRPKKGTTFTGYTLGHAIDDYLKSRSFTDLAEGSKQSYESLLFQIGKNYGKYPLNTLTRQVLEGILADIESTGKRNKVLSKFRLVLAEAVKNERIEYNFASDIKSARHKAKSYKAWSLNDIEKFKSIYPAGTTQRLALYLLYYTGQRSSDVVKMGNHSIKGGRIIVTQQKTGTKLSLPIHPKLRAELPDRDIWLINGYGNPFAIKGFQQWLVKHTKHAGLQGLSGHGLRAALATHLANKGATPHMIRAITGHKNLGEVSLYTQEAEMVTLADQAMDLLD